jgi:hypothetical protein
MLWTSAAMVVLVLSGCGGAGDEPEAGQAGTDAVDDREAPPGTDGSIEACALVTEEDAVRILGEDVTGEESDVTDDPVQAAECVWTNVAEDHGAVLQFRIFKQAALYQEQTYASEAGFEDVTGLGDDAYAVVTDTGVTLDVLVGDQVLQFDASRGGGGFDPAAALDELKILAERVMGELGST